MAEVNFEDLTPDEKAQMMGEIPISQLNPNQLGIVLNNMMPLPADSGANDMTPYEFKKPENFKQGVQSFFKNAVGNPLMEALYLREPLEDRYTKMRIRGEETKQEEIRREQERRRNLAGSIAFNRPQMSLLDLQTLSQMDYEDLSKIASEMKSDPTALQGYPGTLGQKGIFNNVQEILIEPTKEEKNIKAAGGYDSYLKRVEKQSVAQASGDTLKELNKRSFDDIFGRRKEIQTGVKNYGQSMANLEAARDLFAAGDIESGAGQSVIDFFRSLGARVEGFNPDLAGNELLSAIGSAFVVPLVKQLGANPTDTDLAEIQKQAPDLAKTPEGNALLIEFQIIAQNRARMRMETLRAFEDANEDLLRENPQRYNRLLDQTLFDLEVSSEFKGPKLLELKRRAASVLQTVADGKIVGDAL